jgi:hypothetical protein
MALLLYTKERAYPQTAPASKSEAQEVRSKENPNWKKPGGKKKRKSNGWFYNRCRRPDALSLKTVWFFSGVHNNLLSILV